MLVVCALNVLLIGTFDDDSEPNRSLKVSSSRPRINRNAGEGGGAEENGRAGSRLAYRVGGNRAMSYESFQRRGCFPKNLYVRTASAKGNRP